MKNRKYATITCHISFAAGADGKKERSEVKIDCSAPSSGASLLFCGAKSALLLVTANEVEGFLLLLSEVRGGGVEYSHILHTLVRPLRRAGGGYTGYTGYTGKYP